MKTLELSVARKVAVVALVFGAWAAYSRPIRAQSDYKNEVRADQEEIYVFRTTRTDRKTGATPACSAAPFATGDEQDFDLWSIEVRGADSRVVNTHRSGVGEFIGCFSRPAADYSVQMYAAGKVAGVPWTGVGECIVAKAQPPVHTVVTYTCKLDLSELPAAYSGGFIVSSTLATLLRGQPPTAHVPGYVSTSIVTMRLWKKPGNTAAKTE